MGVLLLFTALILAQGNGFMVKPPDLIPYWQTYVRTQGTPNTIQAKREIMMNYLGDYLLYKRALELKLDQDKSFKKNWDEAKAEVLRRCKKEKISGEARDTILKRVKRTLLITGVIEKEVLPKIKITEEEIQQLVMAHERKKRGRKLDRENAIHFLEESKQAEALNSYIDELMNRYKVKINEKALKDLELPVPSS